MATISLPGTLIADIDEQFIVDVTIDDASEVKSVDLTVTFDSNLITALGALKGSLLSALDGGFNTNDDWTVQTNTDTPGELKITAFSAEPLAAGSSGVLFQLGFQVNDGVTMGDTALDLTEGSVGIGSEDVTVDLVDGAVTIGDVTSDNPPTTTGIADVTVNEDADNTVISLFDAFDDTEDADADLTYTIVSNSNTDLLSETTIDPNTGELTLAYASNVNGTTEITVQAEDTAGQTVTTAFEVTVNPINDVPSFTLGADQSVDEDTGLQTVIDFATNLSPGGGTDEASQTLSFTISTDNDDLFSTLPSLDPSTGTLTYTPVDNANGSTTITVTLQDDGGTDNGGIDTTEAQTFTITVNPVNDDPTVENSTFTIGQNQSFTFSSLQTAADIDGDTLTLANVADPANGIVVDNGDGTITYTPDPDFAGDDSFTYTITDGAGGTATATVDLTVSTFEPTAMPSVIAEIDDITTDTRNDQDTIDLLTHFDDPFTTGKVARFELYDSALGGAITDVLLFDQSDSGAPLTVENFITYVEDGDYEDTIIHRSVPGFIIQGGGFTVNNLAAVVNTNPSLAVSAVPPDPSVQNEFSAKRSNIRGTIAMAKLSGDPNSATSQWFFNLDDNSENLDTQNGGFTVFGEVLSETDLAVLDAIAAIPDFNGTSFFNQSAFTDIPLIVDDPGDPVITGDENLVRYQTIELLQQDELSFEVIGNSNPNLVDVTIENEDLILDYLPGQIGTADITVRAINLVGETIEDTFSVTVNDAVPTTSGIDDVVVNEDAQTTVISLFDAFDDVEDTDAELTYSILSNSNSDLFTTVNIDANTGELSLDYAPDLNGEAEITVQVEDTLGQTVNTNFMITVNAVNDAPDLDLGDDQTIVEDAGTQTIVNFATNLNPGGGDDEANQNLNLDISTDNDTLFEALPTIDPNTGDLTYTPATNANGTATVTVTLQDDGGTDNGGNDNTSQTFEIIVTPENDDPVAQDDSINTGQGIEVTIDVLVNDTDVDGDTLTIDSFTTASNGTVIDNGDGTFTYTPEANFIGQDNFTYTIIDAGNVTDTATVTIDVAANSSPNATNDTANTTEDNAVIISVIENDSDPENDDFNITAVGESANGTAIDNGDGTVTYTPDQDFNGEDSFTYTITDSFNGSDTATVTVTIDPINDPPIAQDDATSTNEDLAVSIDLLSNDSDVENDDLTITNLSQPSNGEVANNGDGTVIYTPDPDFNGSDSFTYTIEDESGESSGASVSITVEPINDPPVVTSPVSISLLEDTETIVSGLSIADVDAGTNSIIVNFSVDAGSLTLADTIAGGVESGEISGNGTTDITVTATLEQINTSLADGVGLAFTPVSDSIETVTLTIDVDDQSNTGNGGNQTTSETVSLLITAINDAPEFELAGNQTIDEDSGAQTIDDFATNLSPGGGADEASQSLTLTVTNDNNDLFASQPAIDEVTGQLTYTLASDAFGVATVTVALTDDGGTDNNGEDTTEQTFTITVNAVEDDPVAVDDSVNTINTRAITIDVLANDSDSDGDTLTVASFGNPSNGSLTDNGDGTLTYTPDANFIGEDTFTYAVSDGSDPTDTATVTVTVTDNEAPTLQDIEKTGLEDQAISFSIVDFTNAFEDPDQDNLESITITALLFGALRLNGAEVVVNDIILASELSSLEYTPPGDANEQEIGFQVTASDGTDSSGIADVIVNLTPVNDAPNFALIENADQVNQGGAIVSIENFADNISVGPDNESTQTPNFTVTVEGDDIFAQRPALSAVGRLTYALAEGVTGQATVRVSLSDDGGTANGGINSSGEQTFTITATSLDNSVDNPVDIVFNADGEGLIRDTFAYNFTPAGEGREVSTQLTDDVLNLGVEAAFDNLVGLYEIVDVNGGIDTDNDGIADLFPQSQSAYALFAITNRVDAFSIRSGSSGDPSLNTTTEQFGDVILTGGRLYAPFVIANGGATGFDGFISAENAESDGVFNDAADFAEDLVSYFAFTGANPDGAAHLRSLGNNIFGFEDLPSNLGISDNDFDDAIFQFNFA